MLQPTRPLPVSARAARAGAPAPGGAQPPRGRPPGRTPSDGLALVEFTLCLPLFVLLLFLLADFARIHRQAIVLTQAARVGVQQGLFGADRAPADMVRAAREEGLRNGLDMTGATVEARRLCQCPATGELPCSQAQCPGGGGRTPEVLLEVRTALPFQSLLEYPGLGGVVALQRSARMRVR